MSTNKVSLPVEKCFNLFDQSFNRVKYFSCIMDNLNTAMLPNKWNIRGKSGLNYSMREPDDKQYLVDGCKHFMQRYLVRDCVESFALCLDELFFVLLLHGKKVLAKHTLLNALPDEEKERLTDFQNAGLFGKAERLENQFNLKLSKRRKKVITSLKDIRNCFAHSNGTVRAHDGQKDGKQSRKFFWMTMDIYGVGVQSGERLEIEFNKQLEEDTDVFLEIKEHSKSFKKGEALSFSSAETYEISSSLHLAAAEIIKNTRGTISANNDSR